MRRWREDVDGRWVVVVYVLISIFLGDVFGDTAFLHAECVCGRFVIDIGSEKGCGEFGGVERLAGPEENAGHGVDHVKVGRFVVSRRHARRGLYMLVKPSADDSLRQQCVCVCLWKGGMRH